MGRRWKTWLILAVTLLSSLGAAPHPQQNVVYERYDVDIDVQANGSLLVVETYQIRFEGEFHTGFAEIPLDYVTDVADIQVRQAGRPYTEGDRGLAPFVSTANGTPST